MPYSSTSYPVTDLGLKARTCIEISASSAYMITSGAAGIVSLPVGFIAAGVKSFQSGDGVVQAMSTSLVYTANTLVMGLARIAFGFFGVVAGIIAGTGLELYDRCICWNVETLPERGRRVNSAHKLSHVLETFAAIMKNENGEQELFVSWLLDNHRDELPSLAQRINQSYRRPAEPAPNPTSRQTLHRMSYEEPLQVDEEESEDLSLSPDAMTAFRRLQEQLAGIGGGPQGLALHQQEQ